MKAPDHPGFEVGDLVNDVRAAAPIAEGSEGCPFDAKEFEPAAAPGAPNKPAAAASLRLEPDRNQIEIFVDALFRYAGDKGFVAIRSFCEGADKPFRISSVKLSGGLQFLVDVAEDDARRAAQNPAPVVFCPPIAVFAGKDRAREEDVLSGLALAVECDERPQRARATLECLLGRATIVVESGGTWVNDVGESESRLHVYWRLARPAQGKDELAKLKAARELAARLVGADPSCAPVCHPIRWPGSWHRKAEPRLAEIVSAFDVEVDLDEALALLRDAAGAGVFDAAGAPLGIDGTPEPPHGEHRAYDFWTMARLRAPNHAAVVAALAVIPNDNRGWVEWNHFGMAIWAATGGSEMGHEAFAAWSAKSKKNLPQATDARWQHYKTSPPSRIGFGTLVHWARHYSPGWAYEGGPAPGKPSGNDTEIERLARLSTLEYERQRKEAAEALGSRTLILDRLVNAERERLGLDGDGDSRRLQGRAVELPEPRPSDDPVDGGSLLDAIVKAIQAYIVLSEHAARSCAVWTVYTFLAEHFLVSPRLCISSPVMGCGKSTLTDIISRLVLRPLKASNATAAAIFRVVEMHKPCLLIDEGDTFVQLSEELRGILNSGHRHDGAVLRVVGEEMEPRLFATFSPCSVALIGDLPPTLADRSILVALKRRRPADGDVKSFSLDEVGHLDLLARQSARWAEDHVVEIAAAKPEMPDGIINRARDNWRVLKAIATVVGGEWPDYIDAAALAAQARTGEETSQLEQLLADVKAVAFDGDDEEVRSADLVQRLVELEGRPWAEMGKGDKALTQNKLARMLKPVGIGPENVGPMDARARGYRREQFDEAFERYLGVSKVPICTERDETRTSCISEVHSPDDGCAVGKSKKPNNKGLLCGWAVAKGENGETRARHPVVTFFGVEPFDPCVQCGKTDGVVQHVRFNRHPGRPSLNLHEACIASWLALNEGD